MSGYKHPSWNWDQWEALWPKRVPEHEAFSVAECSAEFQRLWKSDSDILTVMTTDTTDKNVGLVSLASIRQFAQRLEKWMTCAHTEENMTLPPSVSGFHRAIAAEIETNPSTQLENGCIAVALAIVRPGDVARALRAIPEDKLSNDWKKIRTQIAPYRFSDKPEAKKEQPAPTIAAPQPVAADRGAAAPQVDTPVENVGKAKTAEKTKAPRKEDFPDKQKAEGEKWVGWLKALEEFPSRPVKIEAMNGFIKKEVAAHKGTGPEALNYWFEDVALPALCTLPVETLKEVLDVWPPHTEVSFNDPVRTMSSPRLWRDLRLMKYAARSFVLDDLLPQLMDTSAWTDEQRLEMFKHMTNTTQRHDWLFEERVRLWLKWGGNLDAEVVLPSQSDSVFDTVKTQSVRQWVAQEGVATWDTVMAQFPTPLPRSALGM